MEIGIEIQFRVWDTYNERMVYDPDRFEPSFDLDKTEGDERFNTPYIYYEHWQDREDGIRRPCFVMQYTGLNDKDGKKIFEGDILFYESRNQWFKVFRVGGGFAVNTHQDDFKKEKVLFYEGLSDMQNGSWISGLEIKGNIYENIELLNN